MSTSRRGKRRLGFLLLPGAAAALLLGALVATPAQHSHGATSGTPLTWGNNEKGQLGDGTLISRPDPEYVQGLSGIVEVAGGGRHSLALREDGVVFAWGSNDRGQLGDGTTIDEQQPVQVKNLTNVVAIAAGGEFSMALTADGSVWTWGDDSYAQLGDGLDPSGQPAGTPADCTGIVLGGSCITDVRFPDGNGVAAVTLPEQVPGLANVTQISAGQNFALALTLDGSLLGWGEDDHGELASYGDAFADVLTVPVPVPVLVAAGGPLGGVTSVSAGAHHGLARMSDGSVEAWGLDDAGQLGNPAGVDGGCACRTYALPVLDRSGNPLLDIRAVSGGGQHSLAIRDADGAVYAWGDNTDGQLGDGTTSGRETPKEVQGLSGIIEVAAGGHHSLAIGGLQLTIDGQRQVLTVAYGWGLNSSGQAGTHQFDDPTCQCRKLAAPVTGSSFLDDVLSNVTDIAAGDIHSLAIASAAIGRLDQQLSSLQFFPDGGSSTTCQPGMCPPTTPPCTTNCVPTVTPCPTTPALMVAPATESMARYMATTPCTNTNPCDPGKTLVVKMESVEGGAPVAFPANCPSPSPTPSPTASPTPSGCFTATGLPCNTPTPTATPGGPCVPGVVAPGCVPTTNIPGPPPAPSAAPPAPSAAPSVCVPVRGRGC